MSNEIQNINAQGITTAASAGDSARQPAGDSSFGEILKKSLDEVNDLQKEGQKAMGDIATGQVKDLHQAAIAIDKAEMSMKMMLEVRNKAINAYKEILRTQI
ncbi:MAG: flagellar hook-basal body complex protein FliE [Epsilonproteobacteria bacterium]|nr:flagellar hook-basal body complex protein FliE [Campylobacterota bacterium]